MKSAIRSLHFWSGKSSPEQVPWRKSSLLLSLAMVLIVQILIQAASAGVKYTVSALVPPGQGSRATALSAQGNVVGVYYWKDRSVHVYLNHAGIMHDINLAPLLVNNSVPPLEPVFSPVGINIYGRIAGDKRTVGLDYSMAFTYFEKKFFKLDTNYLLNTVGVNDASHILGHSGFIGGFHPWIWQKSGITFLTLAPGTDIEPSALNNKDQVTGSLFDLTTNTERAVLYSAGQTLNLGTLPGGTISFGSGLNDQGQVTGESNCTVPGWSVTQSNPDHAFLYTSGKMQDLQAIGDLQHQSAGIAVNNSGQVVGNFSTVGVSNIRAFLYDNGQMVDLNTLIDPASGWILYEAVAINDAGQIIGNGTYRTDLTGSPLSGEGFLLTPIR